VPLVHEAFDWEHGVFLGSTMSSETTPAAARQVRKLRFDPFAMLPFCGYHMADYIGHWLEIGRRADAAKLPRIFYVNWFRKGEDGHFLWPGYGENSRVLEWVFRRCAGDAGARETPIGLVPSEGDLYTGGLDTPVEDLEAVLSVNRDELREQLPQVKEHFAIFGDRLPAELRAQLEALERRLNGI
jgi:phosphoenolpyruvate carboxykinase (GTP)